MLEQKIEKVEFQESSIDDDKDVYLITWCPDPKELPDSDFYLQHNVNVQTLADYLKCTSCGLWCVESTQLGNPHYHGWYQIDEEKEVLRISIVKTMERFGMVKIAKARTWKVFNWKEHKNALYYYKKDLLGSMMTISPNPIDSTTESTVNFEVLDIVGFFAKDTKNLKTVKDKMSDRKYYRSFYGDTISHLKI